MSQRGLCGPLFVLGLILPLCHPVDSGCVPVEEKLERPLEYKRAPFIEMNIAESPNDLVLPLGDNITLVCISYISFADVPKQYLQTYWMPIYFYEDRIKQCGGSEADREDSKTCEVHIVNGTRKDSGNYSCQAHNELTCIEVTLTLIFKEPSAPRFVVHPRHQLNVSKGQSTSLSCEVDGVPRPEITWFKDDLPLSKASVKEREGFSMLTLNDVSPSDQGHYWCEARNSKGENRSLVTNLTVLWKPMFSVHPANISVHENANVTLSCKANGSPPLAIDWRKDNMSITITNATFVQNGSFSWLLLHLVQAKEAAGKYVCVATNTQGTTVSWEGTVNVLSDPGSQEGGPSFYQHPEGIKTSRGSAVKFTCSARGLPRPIITWMKDGKAMRDLNAESSQSNDTSTLSIWNVQERHRGSYWCVASSSGLNATSNKATLSLKESTGNNSFLWIILGAVLLVALSLLLVLLYFKQKRWSRASFKLKKELVYMLEKKERLAKENTDEDFISQLRRSQPNGGQMRGEQFTEDDDEAAADHETYLKRMGIDRNWEIPRDKLTITEVKLGDGEFGIVSKGIYLRTNGSEMPVAVKILKDSDNQTERQNLIGELQTLIHVGRHPNIVSLVGACTFEDPICVVIEFVPGGSLYKLLRSSRVDSVKNDPVYANIWSRLTERELLQIAVDVANGMKHLESKQCVHRDLAARNVLIGEGLVAKVADFGMARDISTNGAYIKTSEGRIPWLWMSMEALRGIVTTKADVWSFGVLLWEIVTLGELPHRGVKGVVELHNKLAEGHRLQKPAHCSDELYSLMQQCWKTDANDRPSFQNLRCKLKEFLLVKGRSYINVTFFEEQMECETKEEAV